MDLKTKLLSIFLFILALYSIGYGYYKYIILEEVNFYTEETEEEINTDEI